MSTKSWQLNLKMRCEAVGWRVELSTGNSHFKVYNDKRMLFTFASTPSDKRAMLNALSQAKRAGIEALESAKKLRDERDRLARIETDRASNAAVAAALIAAAPVEFVPPVPVESVEPVESVGPNLGYVNGVAIIAVASAKIKTPIMPEPAVMSDAEELLLEDLTVVYRCAKPAAPRYPDETGACHRTFPSASSLRTHITFHSRKAPDTSVALRTIRDKFEEPPVTDSTKTAASRNGSTAGTPSKLLARVTAAIDATKMMTSGIKNIHNELIVIQNELKTLSVADAETLDKAAQFDALRNMFTR
jgi:hypothetical protein